MSVGDQIVYDAYTGVDSSLLSYTATIELTGNTNPNNETLYGTVDEENKVYQVKNSDVNRVWNVLGVEEGKLLITTSVLDTTLILAKKVGYDNAITILNNISAIYGHGVGAESARSINSNDITKVTGIEITTPTFDDGGTAIWQIGTFNSSTSKNVLVGNYFVADTRGWGYPGPDDYVSSILTVSATSDSTGTVTWSDLVWDNFGNYATSDSVKPVVILKASLTLEKNETTNTWNIK